MRTLIENRPGSLESWRKRKMRRGKEERNEGKQEMNAEVKWRSERREQDWVAGEDKKRFGRENPE